MGRFVSCIAFLGIASASFGTTIYTTEADFLNALQPGYYLEEFPFPPWSYGYPLNGTQADWDFGPVNGWSWHAHAGGGLYSAYSALSTKTASDPLTITFPPGESVTAVGGIFASTDFAGNVVQQLLTVTLPDGTSTSLTGLGFRGFTSSSPISSVTVNALYGPSPNWPQMDHFYVGVGGLGAEQPIPEPATLSLLGLAGLALLRRRRATR